MTIKRVGAAGQRAAGSKERSVHNLAGFCLAVLSVAAPARTGMMLRVMQKVANPPFAASADTGIF